MLGEKKTQMQYEYPKTSQTKRPPQKHRFLLLFWPPQTRERFPVVGGVKVENSKEGFLSSFFFLFNSRKRGSGRLASNCKEIP